MAKSGFVFYESFHKATKRLKPEKYKEVVTALCEYALNGVEPDLYDLEEDDPMCLVFELVRAQIDANAKRYEDGCRGGRPRKNKKPVVSDVKTSGFESEKPVVSEEKTSGFENENQWLQDSKPKDKEKAKEKEKDKEKAKDKDKETVSGGSAGWPSLGEVTAYGHEAGVPALAAKFWQENNRRKWQINGEPIRNWKKLFDSWARTEREASAGVKSRVDWDAAADAVSVGNTGGTTFSEPFIGDDGIEYVTEVAE